MNGKGNAWLKAHHRKHNVRPRANPWECPPGYPVLHKTGMDAGRVELGPGWWWSPMPPCDYHAYTEECDSCAGPRVDWRERALDAEGRLRRLRAALSDVEAWRDRGTGEPT